MTRKNKAKQAPELRLTDMLRVAVPPAATLDKSDGRSAGAKGQFHPNAVRSLEALTPKRFVYRKKRVKGLSTLKKKILMERLRRHQYLFDLSNATPISTPEDCSKKVVVMYGLADGVDLDDPEERQEILSNAKTLLSPFGDVESISLWKSKSPSSSAISPAEAFVQALFFEWECARKAAGTLNGFILAGSPLRTVLCSSSDCQSMEYSTAAPSSSSLLSPLHASAKSAALPGLPKTESPLLAVPATARMEPRAVLMLFNVLQPEDLYGEEDELLEVLSDIFSLTSGLHNVSQDILSLRIRRIQRPRRRRTFASLRLCDTLSFPPPWTVLEVSTPADALTMAQELQGKIVGGSSLQVTVLTPSAAGPQLLPISQREAWPAFLEAGQGLPSPVLLAVSGYIQSEDWTELAAQGSARDELCALKEDLLGLVQASGLVSSVALYPPLPTDRPPGKSDEDEEEEDGEEEQGEEEEEAEGGEEAQRELGVTHEAGLVEVFFSSVEACHRALIYLDGLVLGGHLLTASAVPYTSSEAAEDVLSVLLPPTETTRSPPADLLSRGEFVCIQDERVVHSAERAAEEASAGLSPVCNPSLSRYAQAKQVNKLGTHSAPHIASVAVATEAINALVKELLRLLSTFQQRMKEKNPLQYKRKLRFVTGLRQSLHGVRRGKVKLLVLAPNTEASEELDQQINAVVDEAQRQDVPILYALNKRQLGKALQMSMKQSIVAIFDPDGAYELYRQILRFVLPR